MTGDPLSRAEVTFDQSSARRRVEAVPLAQLSVELGHLYRADYLEGRGPIAHDSTVTYTGDEVPGRQTSYEWRHGLGEIVTTLASTGFQVTGLRESDVLPWPRWAAMRQTPDGWWRLPDDAPRIPLFFALKAIR